MITPTTRCSHDPLSHYLPCSGCAKEEITTLRARVAEVEVCLRMMMKVFDDPAYGGAGYAPFMPGEREALTAARACLAKGEGR